MSLFKQQILHSIATNKGLIIDTHTHIGLSLSQYVQGKGRFCQDIEELKLKMNLYGVDYSFVFPFAELNDNRVINVHYHAGHGFFDSEDFPYQLANEYMFDQIKVNDYKNFLPFIIINPNIRLKQQIECFEKYKEFTFGIKIHTTSNEISPVELPADFINLCSSYNLPIIFHTRACEEKYNCWSVLKFAEKNPKINVCVAHCAGFDKDFFKEIENFDNVFFDVSPLLSLCYLANQDNKKVIAENKLDLNYLAYNDVFKTIFDLAPTHIFWATDDPLGLNIRDKYRRQVAVLKESDIFVREQIQKNVYRFLTNATYE